MLASRRLASRKRSAAFQRPVRQTCRPRGRLPNHLDSAYFDQLASEELRIKEVRGFARYEWHKTNRLNEALDALVYATALASLPNIFTASRPAQANEPPRKSIAEQAAALNALHNGANRQGQNYG